MASLQVRFCPKCRNNQSNFYLEMNDSGQQIFHYKCNTCLFSEPIPPQDLAKHAKLFSTGQLSQKQEREIHADMEQDPSLPRTSSLECPNPECSSRKTGDYEVAYLEYNKKKNLAFICHYCRSTWKSV